MQSCDPNSSERRRSCRPTGNARQGILVLLGAISLLSFIAVPALALKVSPFVAEMAPAGPGARLDYVVENDTGQAVAVQVAIVKRVQKEDGSEDNPTADADFLVFPTQIILLSRDRRTVRVQWLGPVTLDKEQAFRLVAEQLPVDLKRAEPGKSNLQLLVKYQTALYVVPAGVRANPGRDLVVDRAEPVRDGHGRQTIAVTVSNHGLAHVQLRNAQLTVRSSSGTTVTLTRERLGGALEGENILAGAVRRFNIPWPVEIQTGPVSATLEMHAAAP